LKSPFKLLPAQNFAVNAAEAQLVSLLTEDDGSLTTSGRDLEALDEFFTIIFVVELSINTFAYWLRPFFADGWNIFDLVVVSMSLAALGPVQIPINVIRSLRAFRVIRLFGSFQGLKSIVNALASSVILVNSNPASHFFIVNIVITDVIIAGQVLQALLVLLIIASICEEPPPPCTSLPRSSP
jgi:hypothetical protein